MRSWLRLAPGKHVLGTCQPLTSKRWVLGWDCPSAHMHRHWCRSWLWSSCQAVCCCQFPLVLPSYPAGDWSSRSEYLVPHRSTDTAQQLPLTLQAGEREQERTFKSSFILCSNFQVHENGYHQKLPYYVEIISEMIVALKWKKFTTNNFWWFVVVLCTCCVMVIHIFLFFIIPIYWLTRAHKNRRLE